MMCMFYFKSFFKTQDEQMIVLEEIDMMDDLLDNFAFCLVFSCLVSVKIIR